MTEVADLVSLSVKGVTYSSKLSFPLNGKIMENVENYSQDFYFGKCYCIKGKLGEGGWIISELLSGRKGYKGIIEINNRECDVSELRSISYRIGVAKRNIFGRKLSVRIELQEAIKKGKKYTERNILEMFHLDERRISRNLDQLSAERWRASMAIGYALGKKVFCFPWIDYSIIEMYGKIWFGELVEKIKQGNGLIIIPTFSNKIDKDFFDEII
jgi:hypothetical protein